MILKIKQVCLNPSNSKGLYVRYHVSICTLYVQYYNIVLYEGVMIMANTSITIRIDEKLKAELQRLMSNLGLDMTTFFTLAAKQAVREQKIPFDVSMNVGEYNERDYELARKNTLYNEDGRTVIPKDDEWLEETEWDDLFEELKKKHEMELNKSNKE